MTNYKSAPIPSTKMPGGIPYIIGNETAERFSFYGMKTILVIFMTKYLMDQSGDQDDEIGDYELFFSVKNFRESGNSRSKYFYSKSRWKP